MTIEEYLNEHEYDRDEKIYCESCDIDLEDEDVYIVEGKYYCKDCATDYALLQFDYSTALELLKISRIEKEFYLGFYWGIANYDEFVCNKATACSDEVLPYAKMAFETEAKRNQDDYLRDFFTQDTDYLIESFVEAGLIEERR